MDTDNQDNIGDIGVISCPHADNFAVAILDDSDGPGARDVKAVTLVPDGSGYHSSIYGTGSEGASRITGSLLDDLTVQADGSNNGGEVAFIVDGDVAADMTIRKANRLDVGGDISGIVSIQHLDGEATVGDVSGSLGIFSVAAQGTMQVLGQIGGDVLVDDMGDGFQFSNPGGTAFGTLLSFYDFLGDAEITIASQGNDILGEVWFQTGIPVGVSVLVDGDLGGTVETTAIFVTADVDGSFEIVGSVYGGIEIEYPTETHAPITGTFIIGGTLYGYLCASNTTAQEPLPPNVTINSFGSSATICLIPNTCTDFTVAAAAPTPLQESVAKNRYLSVVPGNSGTTAGIRVRLTELPSGGMNGNFAAHDREFRWVGAPVSAAEVDYFGGTFTAAPLQCEPYYTDWSSYGTVHIYGAEVVPGATYEVQLVDTACGSLLAFENNYSTALTVTTTKWGDVSGVGGVPDNVVSLADVSYIIASFQGGANAVIKARAQLQGDVPDPTQSINLNDVNKGVMAFQGIPYPFNGPVTCP